MNDRDTLNDTVAYRDTTRQVHNYIYSMAARLQWMVQRSFFSKYESLTRGLMKKRKYPQSGRCQRIRLSMTRKPLNKPIRRAVQCRDQSVVDRLHDRGHPNKVSMKKKEKRRKGRAGRQYLYLGQS